MNISQLKNWKQRGEVATLFTVAALALMAAGTFLGSQRLVQENVLKLGSFAYDNTYRAHFYKGPTFEEKDRIPGQPNSGYTLIRGSLCFTGTTIPSQLQQFWVHTPQDPNRGYPQKACDNTNADTKDDCIVHEGRTVKYIAPQTSRPYCDSPNVGKANWRAWDFTLKLQAPYSKDLCSGLFVSSTSSFVTRDPIEMDMAAWHRYLGQRGVDCGPTPTPVTPSTQPSATNEPTFRVPTAKPTDNIVVPSGYVTIELRPTDKPRCPDPKKPCPSVTPVGECRNDITCSKANPCPRGYACLHEKSDPLQIGVCISTNPKCNPTSTPTPPQSTVTPQPSCDSCLSEGKAFLCSSDNAAPGQAPRVYCSNTNNGPPRGLDSCRACTPVTGEPVQAKIKGDIIVNSCVKPDAVSTIICEKNNPTRCIDTATTVKFIGQDPTNPNKWLYSYEHLQAPGANGGLESVVKNALYENMQAFAQYTSNGLIREAGRVGFPPSQIGNLRAYATIPSSQSEAIINYEVPKNDIVCPPVSPSVKPSEAPTTIPTPGICKYSATAVVIDEATNLPVPLSQMGDVNKWGLANDKQPLKPTTLFKNYGEMVNGERTSKYTFKTDTLSFRPTDTNALYMKGDKAQVNLYIDTSKWEIVNKIACTGSKGCPFPNEGPGKNSSRPLDQYGSTVDGFNFDCDTNVSKYGWVVKKLPDNNPSQCVMRSPENVVPCTPKNVKTKLKSSSRVEVTWDAPDALCPFSAGVAGDHYRIDLVDISETPALVVKTCDKISKTKAECRVDSSYANGEGDFIRGHNYVANVYAIKEIPGSMELCAGSNGIGRFSRPTRDNGGDEDKPEPTDKPVGGTVMTKQLDWLVNNSTGVCWGAWSHGDCRHGYNGTDDWAQSITDKRFDCLAPRNEKHEVVVRLRNDSNTDSIDVMPKRDDCALCSAVDLKDKDGNPYKLSQCNAGPGVNTTYGDTSVTLKKGQCYMVDENLRTSVGSGVPCAQGDSGVKSSQPRNEDKPQPTPKNGGEQPDPRNQNTVTGTVRITVESEKTLTPYEGSFKVIYQTNTDTDIKDAQIHNVDFENGTFMYTIPNFNKEAEEYTYGVELEYSIEGETQRKKAFTAVTVNKKDYTKTGVWNVSITLNPNGTQPTPEPSNRRTWYGVPKGNEKYRECVRTERFCRINKGEVNNESKYSCGASENQTKCLLPIDKSIITTEGKYFIKPGHEGYKLSFRLEGFAKNSENSAISSEEFLTNLISNQNGVHFTKVFKLNPNIEKYYVYVNLIDESGKRVNGTTGLSGSCDTDSGPCGFIGHGGYIYYSAVGDDYTDHSSLLSTVAITNKSNESIKSVSIASCDSANKCASNTVSVALAAGANTKFKPTFSVLSTTRRLSCVINYTNGTSKQCTPQLITGSNGLQFNITAAANNSVSTTVLSPLKTADTNRDCQVTSADATGLRDLDGNGTVNASDTSLFLSFIGQNACK